MVILVLFTVEAAFDLGPVLLISEVRVVERGRMPRSMIQACRGAEPTGHTAANVFKISLSHPAPVSCGEGPTDLFSPFLSSSPFLTPKNQMPTKYTANHEF